MNNDNAPLFNILADDPTDKDAFGSHQKVAEAISSLVTNEEKGKSIALVGDWGSGKSSVVEMLRGIIKQRDIAHLFVFDAWAHKGDSIRRAFLEKLIDHFSDFTNFPKREWEKVKMVLSKRYEETTIDNTLEPTKWGIALAISLLAVPFGLTLIQIVNKSIYLLATALLFAAAPILVGLIALFIYLRADKEKRKQIISVFTEKGTRKLRSETYRTPEPTSIEFQGYFKKLMLDGLRQLKSKFVIVIDNIDRVEPADAKIIWSAMRTFFETDNGEIAARLWLIVPISEEGISQIWGDRSLLSHHFETKTFQTKFSIAPPVLRDWKSFFLMKLSEAFPNRVDKEEFHDIYRIYRTEVYSQAGYPTPRDIIIFINKVGALFLQRGREIKLRMIALYAALLTSKKWDVNKLIYERNALLRRTTMNLVDSDYARKLAALHYNVPEDKALNVLLGPRIEKAILEKESNEFSELKSHYGFLEVLEDVLEENLPLWVKKDPDMLAFLVRNIEDIDHTVDIGGKKIWERLCSEASRVQAWPALNESTGQSLALLINYKKDKEFCESIIESVSQSEPPKAKEEEIPTQSVIDQWVLGAATIFKPIMGLKMPSIIADNFVCPGEPSTYVQIVKQIISDQERKHLAKYFRSRHSQNEINTVISSIISNGLFDKSDYELLVALKAIDNTWQWGEIGTSMADRIKLINKVQLAELEPLLSAFYLLAEEDEEVSPHLNMLSKQGYFFNYLAGSHSEKNGTVSSLIFLITFENNPTFQASISEGHIPAGAQHMRNLLTRSEDYKYCFDQFANLLIIYHKVDWFLGLLKKHANFEAFVQMIIKNLSLRKDFAKCFSPKNIIEHETDFYNALGDDYKAFILRYAAKRPLLDELMEGKFEPHLASLYLAVYLADQRKIDKYLESMVTALCDISEDIWIKQLEEDSENLYDLVAQLSADDVKINLSKEYQKALNQYQQMKMAGKNIGKIDKIWHRLLIALEPSIRDTHIYNVADNILDRDKSYDKLIDLFGSDLLDCDVLQGLSDNIVRLGFSEFYYADRLEALRWLSNALRSCPDILKKSNTSFKADLRESVKNELKKMDSSTDKGQILLEIAKTLRIKIPMGEPDKNAKSPQSE